MGEYEALIQRRELLLERVSKMNHEVEKIIQRMDFLQRAAEYERIDLFQAQGRLAEEASL